MNTHDDGDDREQLTQGVTKGEQVNATSNTHNESSATLNKDISSYKKKKYIIIGIIAAIILILAIVLPIVLTNKGGDTPSPSPVPVPIIPPGNNPYSGNASDIVMTGETVSGQIKAQFNFTQQMALNSYQQFLALDEQAEVKKLGVNWTQLPFGENNKFYETLNFTFDMVTRKCARFVLTSANETRFSVPETLVPKPMTDSTMRLEMVGFNFSSSPFEFSFYDVSDPTNVFISTSKQSLVFGDKYIQMDFLLPTKRVYGLGERVHELQLGEGAWTMWAAGQDNIYDDGKGRKGLSGVHPFLLSQTGKIGEYIGLFFRNSNAQTPILRYQPDGKSILSYITIAGQLEVYFFVHGSAKSIIQQYQNLIGNPSLPPFWSLGWQEASFANSTQEAIIDTLNAYKNASLPLEVIYFDLNSINTTQDFSINETLFNNITDLVLSIRKNNQKVVGYVPAAISVHNASYNPYYLNNSGLFLKSNLTYTNPMFNNDLVNMQALKKVVYIDWMNETCQDFWNSGLEAYYDQLLFDGLWTTMNEPFGQIHGEYNQEGTTPTEQQVLVKRLLEAVSNDEDNDFDQSWFYSFNQSELSTFKLPFVPQYLANFTGNYDNQTLSLNATHPSTNDSEYNLHSLYSIAMAQKTYNFLGNKTVFDKAQNRPFFLTKGTFAGSGKYASYAITGNWRDWSYLKHSISGIINMNMFGIPHSGADICGFYGQTLDEELCLRWIQLATFYPLARHNQNFTFYENETIDRTEPFQIKDSTRKEHVKASMYDRLQYLRLMYTCLFEVSQWGGTCIDPLFFYYPNDLNNYENYENTFMVAGALKVSPILESLSGDSFSSYFPTGKWVNLADLSEVIEGKNQNESLKVRPTVNVHLRPGTLIPYQNNSDFSANVTDHLLVKPITLIANRDDNGFASGSVLIDYGISRKEINDSAYGYYNIQHQNKSIQFQIAQGTRDDGLFHFIDKIVIANADDLKSTSFACFYDTSLTVRSLNYTYNETDKTLSIYSPQVTSAIPFQYVMNVYYGNDTDLNLCNSTSFQYTIEDGQVPELNTTNVTIKLKHQILPSINVSIGFLDDGIVNVKWTWAKDANGNYPSGKKVPYEVPDEIVNTTHRTIKNPKNYLWNYISISDSPFRIDFKQRQNGTSVTYLSITGMVFDSYLNWVNVETYQNSSEYKGILGLGERNTKDMFFQDGVYSLWTKDSGNPIEDGKKPGKQTYGVHPFYMYRHASQNWIGVYHKLSHASDWWIQNSKQKGQTSIKTIATGGVADLYIITQQQTPDSLIAKYYSIVGKPVMIPQWALGWHQCKWKYKNTTMLYDVVANYEKFKIPLDAQWVDIDYMDNYRDFTYDNNSFNGLPEFVNYLHNNKSMKFVPIIDAGVSYRPGGNYEAFNDGEKQGVWIKNSKGNDFVGEVWPNEAVYPDFTNKSTDSWWRSWLTQFRNVIPFDGLWQDMNEASNFCNGACHKRQQEANPIKLKLPYTPVGFDLETNAISLDATHASGATQIDEHSLFGTRQVKSSNQFFADNNMRTMIISRSSFSGMGKYGSHWTGDNHATVEDMGNSVISVMLYNMFGIPFVGSDICGFNGNTTAQLCARWHQVGAFYPFSRNHHTFDEDYQEPYVARFQQNYTDGIKYTDIMREAIYTKYSLIRYYYSEMMSLSVRGDKSFYKPVFFAFPDDMNTYTNLTNNIMIGDYLKLSINTQNLTENFTDFYFPAGTWCNILNASEACFLSNGSVYTMKTNLTDFYVHIREGSIVPMQNASLHQVATTADLQDLPIDLHILGKPSDYNQTNWKASYVYINDNGNSTVLENKTNVVYIDAEYTRNGSNPKNESLTLSFTLIHNASDYYKNETKCTEVNQNDYLSAIYVYNATYWMQNDQFTVSVIYNDFTYSEVGTAAQDANGRLVLNLANSLCMPSIMSINFKQPVSV